MFRARAVLCIAAAILAVSCVNPLFAAETNHIRWLNDVNDAWRSSQLQGRPLLVFVTRDACLPCAKMKASTYADSTVAAAINDRFVALSIDADRAPQLLKDLAVNAYPVTFVISPQAVILQRMDGYISPGQMAAKLSQVAPKTRHSVPVQPVAGRAF
jgi:protein disulfide-isomerase